MQNNEITIPWRTYSISLLIAIILSFSSGVLIGAGILTYDTFKKELQSLQEQINDR